MKELNCKVRIPNGALVYDFTFDAGTPSAPGTKQWKKWMATVPEYNIDAKTDFKAEFNSIIVPTAASTCYTALLDTLIRGNAHTLVVGPTGTAKSVVVTQKLTRLDPKYEPIIMAFSAQSSANQTQDILDGKFEKRRQGTDKDTGLPFTMWGPMLGKQFVCFLDDFNMPKREHFGAQPPIELMRQMVGMGGWYDRKTFRIKRIVGGGHSYLGRRALLHMA